MLPIRSNASSKLPIWANTAGRLPVWAYTTQPPTPTCIALYAVFGQGKYIYQYFLSFIFSGSVCAWVCTVVICYRPQRSCEGYVFTPVCHSVSRGRGVCLSSACPLEYHPPGSRPPGPGSPPPGKTAALLRTVRILLECILVRGGFVVVAIWLRKFIYFSRQKSVKLNPFLTEVLAERAFINIVSSSEALLINIYCVSYLN